MSPIEHIELFKAINHVGQVTKFLLIFHMRRDIDLKFWGSCCEK